MRGLRWFGAVFTVAMAGVAQAARAPTPVFDCSFGAKRVLVTRPAGNMLRYEFGAPGKPEIVILGDPAQRTVRYHRTLFAHSENKQLHFVRGDYSYVLFNRWSSPDYDGTGAEDRSGLVVSHRHRTIAKLICRRGGEFSTVVDLDALPDDGEENYPE